MKVYAPANAQWIWADRLTIPSCTVLEPDPQQRFSGLLDANGNKLMVTEKTAPIGFVTFEGRS